jgi:hypothetical protein
MRRFIDIVTLMEAKTMMLPVDDYELRVLVSPHRRSLAAFISNNQDIVRGNLIDGKWHFWCAYLAYHFAVSDALGEEGTLPIVVSNSLQGLTENDDWEGAPYGFFRCDDLYIALRLQDREHPAIEKLFPHLEIIEEFEG